MTRRDPNVSHQRFQTLAFPDTIVRPTVHGTLHSRIDTSDHVLFVNDQLAVHFIEEIDFDYMANDATAALLTTAS